MAVVTTVVVLTRCKTGRLLKKLSCSRKKPGSASAVKAGKGSRAIMEGEGSEA